MSRKLKKYFIRDIGKVAMCKRILKEETSEFEKIPFYKISTFGGKADTFISREKFLEYKEKYSFPKKGDILISAAGTIGKTVIYNGEDGYFQDSNIVWIENNESKVLNAYLYYFYQTKPWITTNGSTINRIYNENLRSIEFTVPEDLETQRQIASVLSSLDSKIELNNRINAELEAMAKTIYDYWFVQFDFPSPSPLERAGVGLPYKSSGGKMVWNEELKREVPEGWEVGTFGSYAKAKGGFAFKSEWWSDEGLPVIKIKDINEDYTLSIEGCSFVGEDKYERAKNYEAFAGDVVIAMTGATVGKYGIVPKINKPILVNQRVALFDLGKEPLIKLPFLINSLNQKYFRETVFVLASGAAQPNISSDQIDNIPLLIPSKILIDKYNEMLSINYQKIINNKSENQQLTSLRDWLLPMLMNGQVSVKQAEEALAMAAEEKVKYGK